MNLSLLTSHPWTVGAIWVALAIVIWLVFYYTWGNKPSDIMIPPWVFILAIALWPISLVVLVIVFLVALVATAFGWRG
jgi:hypothetical protein